jgi:hypothetical protein
VNKSVVKAVRSTDKPPPILFILSAGEGDGIPGVAVKCVDIRKNTCCEGGHLVRN